VAPLIAIFVSLLPERWRPNGFVTSGDAFASGAIQFAISSGLLLYRYINFANARLLHVPLSVKLGAAERGGETAVMGMGIFVMLEFFFYPLTILLFYFMLEGLVRTAAAFVSGETVATLPLVLLARMQAKTAGWYAEKSLGKRVPDLVESPGPPGFDLSIVTCRPKPEWDHLSTISYRDELYEVVQRENGSPPYRFVYLLRRKPAHKIVRALYRYDPEEVLR
jgi:hypothetical protein